MGDRSGQGSTSLGVIALDLANVSSAAAITSSASGGADWVPPPFESPPGHEMDGLLDLPPEPIIGRAAGSPRSREERSLRTRSVGMPSASPGYVCPRCLDKYILSSLYCCCMDNPALFASSSKSSSKSLDFLLVDIDPARFDFYS